LSGLLEPIRRELHQELVPLESLPVDEQFLGLIVEDLRNQAARHQPIASWVADGGGEGVTGVESFEIETLIQSWLGFGSTRVSPESLFWYYGFLRDIDGLGLMRHYFDDETSWRAPAQDLRVADLGTILDLNLMAPFLQAPSDGPLRVVEVGGGYGRLAEAFLNIFGNQVRFVLIDAVPGSLLLAYEYLRRCNPSMRIGFDYLGDPFDLERYDCYIAPSWRTDPIPEGSVDLAINVQSMQEMEQHHVDEYLAWFDRALKPGSGIAYFCNRRDHLFRGEYRYPDHWQLLLKTCTPRSWVRDFPAELFRKGERCYTAENRLHAALYERDLGRESAVLLATAKRRGYSPY
jgi:SAM-dependent methyltransferase